ncbi:MAG: ABC transporter permease [Tannerella sp.]|jgi:ABC-2 type transport system permease protein|nr:ABC transporter permease [Tannerella sp.]
MKNFVNLLYKDFLLLIRDFWGVVLLFMMPWALVLMMTYLQDSTFRSVNETRIPLYLLNNDKDSLGNMVSNQILASNIFEVSTEVNGRVLSAKELEEAVSQGNFLIGVIIPENATASLRDKVRQGVERAFNGEEERSVMTSQHPLEIKLLVDPTAKESFRTSLIRAMHENALVVQNQLLLSEITRQVNRLIPMPVNLNIDTGGLITIDESYAQSDKAKIIPNSTQHNVPAWGMFAIFFIVISLAGNMIREREIGCFNRLMTMPCSFHSYVLSKVGIYLCVCLLQLTLIILTGMYMIPLLGLPALKLGHSIPALLAMSLSSSLAAIGYGLAIGSVARTNQQASVFGAVSVVILAAIGGVWVPTFIMPRFMQIISHISPLNWGLNGFNDIFVRDAGFFDVVPYVSASILFFIITISVSYYSNRKRKQ